MIPVPELSGPPPAGFRRPPVGSAASPSRDGAASGSGARRPSRQAAPLGRRQGLPRRPLIDGLSWELSVCVYSAKISRCFTVHRRL